MCPPGEIKIATIIKVTPWHIQIQYLLPHNQLSIRQKKHSWYLQVNKKHRTAQIDNAGISLLLFSFPMLGFQAALQ